MLIFSQWTKILDLLEVLLDDISIPFLRLDGSTPIAERQQLINRFKYVKQSVYSRCLSILFMYRL